MSVPVSFVRCLVLATLLGACGSGATGAATDLAGASSCRMPGGVCAEGGPRVDVASFCSLTGGASSLAPCPRDGVVGTCILHFGEPTEIRLFYSAPEHDPATSRSECAGADGVWMP